MQPNLAIRLNARKVCKYYQIFLLIGQLYLIVCGFVNIQEQTL